MTALESALNVTIQVCLSIHYHAVIHSFVVEVFLIYSVDCRSLTVVLLWCYLVRGLLPFVHCVCFSWLAFVHCFLSFSITSLLILPPPRCQLSGLPYDVILLFALILFGLIDSIWFLLITLDWLYLFLCLILVPLIFWFCVLFLNC
jgi:hypothetical protein